MSRMHEIQGAEADPEGLHLIVDGRTYLIRWEKCSARLAKATAEQRQHMDIAPSGYGISWPEIDEDLTINWLVRNAVAVAPA